MASDPYLQDVAIMVDHGFKLTDIWAEFPWEGDMPDDMIEIFGQIYKNLENEKLQKLV